MCWVVLLGILFYIPKKDKFHISIRRWRLHISSILYKNEKLVAKIWWTFSNRYLVRIMCQQCLTISVLMWWWMGAQLILGCGILLVCIVFSFFVVLFGWFFKFFQNSDIWLPNSNLVRFKLIVVWNLIIFDRPGRLQ